jgi:hypothetical protein
MWVREALEDLTAAEFASSLSLAEEDKSGSGSSTKESGGLNGRKRAVDFENVLAKLDARVDEMCILTNQEESAKNNQTCYVLDRTVHNDEGTTVENSCFVLASTGMGSVVYTTDQREALLGRLMATRGKLIDFMEGARDGGGGSTQVEDGGLDDIRSKLGTNYSLSEEYEGGGSGVVSIDDVKGGFDPSLYVREDGTIDWDGALQEREALKKFGSAVWSRINGQDPESANDEEEGAFGHDDFAHAKPVTAKIVETEAIREKKEYLDKLTMALREMEAEHTKLLNSGKLVCCSVLTLDVIVHLYTALTQCVYGTFLQKQSVQDKP